MTKKNREVMSSLTCDYLVIGAGASAMAFVDELVNASEELTVVLVDKRAKPGLIPSVNNNFF